MLSRTQRNPLSVRLGLRPPDAQPGLPRAATATAVLAAAAPAAIIPPADWNALFNAVAERLHHLAEAAEGGCAALPDTDHTVALRECVSALQQLGQQMGPQFEPGLQGRQRLHAELSVVQKQLLLAQAEIVQLRIDRRQAQHRALHDPLTQLPNRSHFEQRLESQIHGLDLGLPSLAVLYVDLDGFKRINDHHGHAAGDAALCMVARRLSRALRAQDTVCRVGGDEFACLLLAPSGREQISRLVAKLVDVVAAPLQLGQVKLSVQPSIGIALFPGDGDSGAALLKRADAAMFRAKRRQQGYAFFEARNDL